MGKLYYMQWNTGDWRKATGCPEEWVRLFIEENSVYRVADVIIGDAYVTLTCRRIVRDEIKRGQGAERTKRWRAKRQDEEDVTEGDEDVLSSNMYPLGSPSQEGESEGEENPSFDENDPAYQVATRLLEAIIRKKSNFKKPGRETFKRWVTEAGRMLRVDNRELPNVLAVLDWLPTAPVNGSFCWSDNILSVSRLRKQFDQLEIAMDRSRSAQNEKTKHIKPLSADDPAWAEEEEKWNK